MKTDEKMEKLREALNNAVDIRDLCSDNILEVSQLLDDLIMEHYRNQERKRKRNEETSNNKVCRR